MPTTPILSPSETVNESPSKSTRPTRRTATCSRSTSTATRLPGYRPLTGPLPRLVPADGVTGAKSLSGRFKLPLATGQDDGGASVSADQCAGWRPASSCWRTEDRAAVSALVRAVPRSRASSRPPRPPGRRPTVFWLRCCRPAYGYSAKAGPAHTRRSSGARARRPKPEPSHRGRRRSRLSASFVKSNLPVVARLQSRGSRCAWRFALPADTGWWP